VQVAVALQQVAEALALLQPADEQDVDAVVAEVVDRRQAGE